MPSPVPAAPYVDRICFECVGEAYLKNLIQQEGTPDECSHCGEEGPTISIEELADHVDRAFEEHYFKTPADPDGIGYAYDSDNGWDRDGDPVLWAICNALEVDECVAQDVLSILQDRHYDRGRVEVGEECPFSDESHYEVRPVGNGEFRYLWDEFERVLKTESRYFSRSAQGILGQIFSGISDLRTVHGSRSVVTAGPTRRIKSLFRARVFAGDLQKLEDALKKPWLELGTPPSEASGAGRMNARGIAVFYGAQNAKAALAEVRPPVGSQVAIARFDLTRDLRLLDLNALKSISAGGSIFNPGTIRQMQKANFLEILSNLMSRAIMPHEEASEYLPTQAVAEYLANEVGLDGMIFPSVQAGQKGANVVLFHHAARVEEVELPPGTRIESMSETLDSDGVYPEYRVWERRPSDSPNQHTRQAPDLLYFDYFDSIHHDERRDSLRINLDSIQVLHIGSVQFRFESYPVIRHRFEEPEPYPFDDGNQSIAEDDPTDDDLFN